MSSPRYSWWGYVKSIIRRYPELKKAHDEIMAPSITPTYSGMPGGTTAARSTENTAVMSLQKTSVREYYAVWMAINTTRALPDGEDRIKMINRIYWQRTHSLVGASIECYVSERVGREWHRQFIRMVGKEFGLLEE